MAELIRSHAAWSPELYGLGESPGLAKCQNLAIAARVQMNSAISMLATVVEGAQAKKSKQHNIKYF